MPRPPSKGSGGIAAAGLAAFAIVCCAGFPLLVALAGSVAIGTTLGIGAGIVAAALLSGAVILRSRRRKASPSPRPGAGQR